MAEDTPAIIKYWYLWVPVVLYLIWGDQLGETTIQVSSEYLAFYYLVLCLVWALNEQGKYNSPMLIVNNAHICVKFPVFAGEWAVFGDYIDAPDFFMTYPLRKTTVIVPRESVYQLGQNYFSTARVTLTTYYAVPADARRILDTYKWEQTTVYIGYVSEKFEGGLGTEERRVFESLQEKLDGYIQLSNKNRETAKLTLEDIEEIKSSLDRLNPKPQTVFGKALESLRGGSDEAKKP